MRTGARATCALAIGVAVAAAAVPTAAAEVEPQIVYPFVGVIQVFAPENAVSGMYLGLYGTVEVSADGTVSGGGAMIYDQLEACAWEPPHPDGETAPYCNIEDVIDAAFSVTGTVVETVHRHDDDNPLKDAVFALADNHSSERLGYAPLTLRLTLSLDGILSERLAFWGFSQPGIQFDSTQAATLGAYVSGLFDMEFEIAPIAMIPLEASAHAETIAAARQYASEGDYHGGTPLSASGSVGFVDIDPARLPTATNPWTWLQHAVEPAGERPLSEDELAAIADYEEPVYDPSGEHDRLILQGGMEDLAETLTPYTDGAAYDPGPSPYSPIGLLDDTRASAD